MNPVLPRRFVLAPSRSLLGPQEVAKTGRLPVVNFAAGGIATPADAALMMQLGVDGEASPALHSSRSDARLTIRLS